MRFAFPPYDPQVGIESVGWALPTEMAGGTLTPPSFYMVLKEPQGHERLFRKLVRRKATGRAVHGEIMAAMVYRKF
jgi:hypothetical protein